MAERMHRTILNMIRSLLFQVALPSNFWVEALHTTMYLLNILPTTCNHHKTPFELLLVGLLLMIICMSLVILVILIFVTIV